MIKSGYQFETTSGAALSPGELRDLIRALARALPGYRVEEYFTGKPASITASDTLTLIRPAEGGDPIGVLGSSWHTLPELSLLYYRLVLLGTEHRGTSVARKALVHNTQAQVEKHGEAPSVGVLRTMNPTMYHVMRKFLDAFPGVMVFPAIGGPAASRGLCMLAQRIAAEVAPSVQFVPETSVLLDANHGVPDDFYPRSPFEGGDDDVTRYFARHLRLSDRMLCMGFLPTSAVKQAAASIISTLTV